MAQSQRNPPKCLKYVLLALFGGALLLFFLLGGQEYFGFETIKESRETLIDYKNRHYAAVFAASLLIFTAATLFSLPIAGVLSLLAGLLFGPWLGTAVIVLGGALGAMLLLIAARYVFTDFFKRWKRVAGHHELFDQAFCRHGFLYIAFLRVLPVMPFWLVNLGSAFTRIRLRTYVSGTIIGMLPTSFIWAKMGERLETVSSPDEVLSGSMLILLTVIGVLGIGGIIGKEYFFRTTGKRARVSARSR